MNCLKCQTFSCFLGTSTRSFKFLVSDKSQTWSAKPHLSRMSWHLDITIWRLERAHNRALHGLSLLILFTSLKPRPKPQLYPSRVPFISTVHHRGNEFCTRVPGPENLRICDRFCFVFCSYRLNEMLTAAPELQDRLESPPFVIVCLGVCILVGFVVGLAFCRPCWPETC